MTGGVYSLPEWGPSRSGSRTRGGHSRCTADAGTAPGEA